MQRTGWVVSFLVSFVLIFAAQLIALAIFPTITLQGRWLLTALFFLTLLIAAGGLMPILDRPRAWGALIDPLTNTMSLSRLQLALWLWVILSAWITLVVARLVTNTPDPLAIQFPPPILGLLGISLTSGVAAPLLTTDKGRRTAEQDVAARQAMARTYATLGAAGRELPPEVQALVRQAAPAPRTYQAVLERRVPAVTQPPIAADIAPAGAGAVPRDMAALPAEPSAIGALYRKARASDASLSDLFTGEEVSTFGYVDIAKLQNLLFTIIVVAAYAGLIWNSMAGGAAGFSAFPDVPGNLLALIGISHAGYLVDRPAVHSVPE